MKILVTAGPTQEPIDPVRFISNRSSGKMGYAVARVAANRGHDVRLVSGPVTLRAPRGVRLAGVRTAGEMLAAVRAWLGWCDALVMTAAVADWTPAEVSPVKLKKRRASLALRMVPTTDILRALRPAKGRRLFVGFAAETGDADAEARRKLVEKGLDLIVANDVSQPGAGFEVDTNIVTLLEPDGDPVHLPIMSKTHVAARIVRWMEAHGG